MGELGRRLSNVGREVCGEGLSSQIEVLDGASLLSGHVCEWYGDFLKVARMGEFKRRGSERMHFGVALTGEWRGVCHLGDLDGEGRSCMTYAAFDLA